MKKKTRLIKTPKTTRKIDPPQTIVSLTRPVYLQKTVAKGLGVAKCPSDQHVFSEDKEYAQKHHLDEGPICCEHCGVEHPTPDVWRAKRAFDEARDARHAVGMEVCMIVVGYVSGRDPFRLLGRVSADVGLDEMPDPALTSNDMQPVAFAAKMAFAKVLRARKKTK